MFREVELLREQARAWGGDIIEVSEKQFEAWFRSDLPVALDEFSEAPFTSFDLGIHWSSRTIYYADYPKGQPAYLLWTAIVHEMGHVFASLDLPGKSTEFSFFGWEHQVAKLIVGDVDPWYRAQRDYGVDGGDFGDYPRAKQEEIVQAKIAEGVSLGILDADGNPQVLTRPTYPREAFPNEVYARMEKTFAEVYRGRSPSFAEGYESALREAVTILSSMIEKPRPVPESPRCMEIPMFKPGEVAQFRDGGAAVTIIEGAAEPTPLIPWPVVTRLGVVNESELIPSHPTVLITAGLLEPEPKEKPLDFLAAILGGGDSVCPYELVDEVKKLLKGAKFDTNGHWKRGTQLAGAEENLFRVDIFSLKKEDAEDIVRASKEQGPSDRWVPFNVPLGGHFKCPQCGARDFVLETNGVEIRIAEEPCPFPDNLPPSEWELNVPSGKLIIANDLRVIFPLPGGDAFDIGTRMGCRQTALAYAAVGLSHGFVGNTCPTVYQQGEGRYQLARNAEEGKRVASVTTDLWWYSICDHDEFVRRCERFKVKAKDLHTKVISVRPGVYHFAHDEDAPARESENGGSKECVFTRFDWKREPDPVKDFLAGYEGANVNAHAYVQAQTLRWPTLYGTGKKRAWANLTAEEKRNAWQSVADQVFCTIGGGIEWHERGFPRAMVSANIPDEEPPAFREQFQWYPFSKPFGGLFEAKLNASFAKLAFRVLESVISFGSAVRDGEHSRDVHFVRDRMLVAVQRYRELALEHPDQADSDYVAWLSQEGRAEAWVASFPLGAQMTEKHFENAKKQRWLPEDTYAIAFDARKLKDGGFANHPAQGGCWSQKKSAQRYAIHEWRDNGQKDPTFNCSWMTHATSTSIPLYSLARVVKLGQVTHMGKVLVEVAFDYGTPWMMGEARKGILEMTEKAGITVLTKEEYDFYLPEAVSFFEAAEAKAQAKK